jgi:murein DD-endopeptidase MepM/ murein hydrolase activator NlpD
MKTNSFLLILFLLGTFSAFGQDEVKFYTKKLESGEIEVYADNEDITPYSIIYTAELQNMKSSKKFPHKFVIKPGEKEILIVKLIPEPKKSYSYKSGYSFFKGDMFAKHDDSHVYFLPFEDKKEFLLSQGYFGQFSHKGKHSLDFTMPEGTPIYAARGGVIIDTKSDSDKGCPTEKCKEMANFVIIYHSDGSFGSYFHLKKNGVAVKKGQEVKAGELIGYSGNTGWSDGAHLHFEVYIHREGRVETVPTKFLIGVGEVGELKPGMKYLSIR